MPPVTARAESSSGVSRQCLVHHKNQVEDLPPLGVTFIQKVRNKTFISESQAPTGTVGQEEARQADIQKSTVD